MAVDEKDTQVFVGQKAFIKRGHKVLVMRDPNYVTDTEVGLDFPGGKYRYPGNILEELTREVTEETALKIKIGRPFFVWTAKYREPERKNQKVYLVGFLCKHISGEVKLSNEHDRYEWVDKKTYKKWAEPTGYFKALEEYFKVIKNSDK